MIVKRIQITKDTKDLREGGTKTIKAGKKMVCIGEIADLYIKAGVARLMGNIANRDGIETAEEAMEEIERRNAKKRI